MTTEQILDAGKNDLANGKECGIITKFHGLQRRKEQYGQ